jgi:hypothetical protein
LFTLTRARVVAMRYLFGMLLEHIALVDEILGAHAGVLGADFDAYRNHVYRVSNLCLLLAQGAALSIDRLAVTAAFHDLGIWTHDTFDYIPPSLELARKHLAERGQEAWEPEVGAAIERHHQLRACAAGDAALVELFRRADWIDVTLGLRSFGLPKAVMRELFSHFPDAGFHKRLVQLTLKRTLRHPLSPLPMLRL